MKFINDMAKVNIKIEIISTFDLNIAIFDK